LDKISHKKQSYKFRPKKTKIICIDIKEVTKMTEKDKDHVITLLDAFIARTKLQGFV